MTKILSLLIILIACSLSFSKTFAQNFNSFAGVRFGYALPMGQLASHDFETGGYALLGKSISCEAAWFMTPKIGFGIDISNSSFGFASGYYAEDMKENRPEYESAVQMLSGPYKISTYFGGIYYKVQLIDKFYSTFKLMGGMISARTPDQFYGVEILLQGKTYWWKTGSLDRTFGFLTGASFEYHIFEHVSLLLQADFSYAEPAFIYNTGNSFYTENIKMPILKLLPGINVCF